MVTSQFWQNVFKQERWRVWVDVRTLQQIQQKAFAPPIPHFKTIRSGFDLWTAWLIASTIGDHLHRFLTVLGWDVYWSGKMVKKTRISSSICLHNCSLEVWKCGTVPVQRCCWAFSGHSAGAPSCCWGLCFFGPEDYNIAWSAPGKTWELCNCSAAHWPGTLWTCHWHSCGHMP